MVSQYCLSLTDQKHFTEQVTQLKKTSRYRGEQVDSLLGVNYPPYPKGLDVGALLFTFRHLHDCSEKESHRLMLRLRAIELNHGFMHFVRSRWPRTIKKSIRLPKSTKPLGRWFEATYMLCTQVAPYIEIEGELGVDSAHWFHNCVRDIAITGGIVESLDHLYPAIEEGEQKRRALGVKNQRESQKYCNRLISKIQDSERPTQPENGFNHFGTLIFYAVTAAESDHKIQSGELRCFIKATRDYIKAVEGQDYGKIYMNSENEMIRQDTPKTAKKKLRRVSRSEPTFQELSAKAGIALKAM